jgi:hypothetical protein
MRVDLAQATARDQAPAVYTWLASAAAQCSSQGDCCDCSLVQSLLLASGAWVRAAGLAGISDADGHALVRLALAWAAQVPVGSCTNQVRQSGQSGRFHQLRRARRLPLRLVGICVCNYN